MGPLFVLIFWGFVLCIVALPCVAASRWVAARLTIRSSDAVRKRFRSAATLGPMAVGLYLLLLLAGMGIYGTATGRDLGFGDDFELPLPNGYRWVAVDVPDLATIYDPGGEPTYLDHVVSLQRSGDWLAGGTSDRVDRSGDLHDVSADHWFLLNTKNREHFDATSEAQLDQLTAEHGFRLKLQPSSAFYSSHRYRWYDAVVALLLLSPGMLILLSIYRKARRLLRDSAAPAGSGSAAVGLL